MNHLIMFYGTECSHCHQMTPLVDKLEAETGLKVERLETWHNAANASLQDTYDQNHCGGVPFFINTKTKEWICGSTDYDELSRWARG